MQKQAYRQSPKLTNVDEAAREYLKHAPPPQPRRLICRCIIVALKLCVHQGGNYKYISRSQENTVCRRNYFINHDG